MHANQPCMLNFLRVGLFPSSENLARLRSEHGLRTALTRRQERSQVSALVMAKENHRRPKCHGRVTGMAVPLPSNCTFHLLHTHTTTLSSV